MSKLRSRNSLLSSGNRSSHSNNSKSDVNAMKFSMDRPTVPLYPFNDPELQREESEDTSKRTQLTYPDFNPWKDEPRPDSKMKQETDKLDNAVYLNKGYFEPPQVSNEYYSARQLVQATIFSSTDNYNGILSELSKHLVGAYEARNEQINKIKFESNSFKIPPRVTLTVSKRELWFNDLANPEVPLSKIAGKIPHGIRNKVLIDMVCTKNVPISRALWFTKCVLYSELTSIKKKYHTRFSLSSPSHTPMESTLSNRLEDQWFQEWTLQVSDYIHKFSREMDSVNSMEKKEAYMSKLGYLLTYVSTLYVESLLVKPLFLSTVTGILREALPSDPLSIKAIIQDFESDDDEHNFKIADTDINYGRILISITIIKYFWLDVVEVDFVCKEASEWLLLVYFYINHVSTQKCGQDFKYRSSFSIRKQVLCLISSMIINLFKRNSNIFIIPNYWPLAGDSLLKILLGDKIDSVDTKERKDTLKQFRLIEFRNKSLMLNMKDFIQQSFHSLNSGFQRGRRSFSEHTSAYMPMISSINAPVENAEGNSADGFGNWVYINRDFEDSLRIVDQLDRLRLNKELAVLISPNYDASSQEIPWLWKKNIKLVIYWCISSYRNVRNGSECVLIICNFLKREVVQMLKSETSTELKAEFESEILDVIYNLVDSHELELDFSRLYLLINELYQLKIITISSYLRKLIASGVFYLSPEQNPKLTEQIKVHLNILQNLPVLNSRQCDSILKRWEPEAFNYNEKFEIGKAILKEELISKVTDNSFDVSSGGDFTYFTDLKVGLRFLCVNWATNELKVAIRESQIPIRISSRTVLNLYSFYSCCDNLTAFFKELVKFILRNEQHTMSFSLNTLYVLSKLVIKHFKLVKFIADRSHDFPTTALELFKWIYLNYKEKIAFSNTGCSYDFSNIWKFIDGVVEKFNTNSLGPDASNSNAGTHVMKDSFETPMKINHLENFKADEVYTAAEFRNDLDRLMEQPSKFLDQNEVIQLVSFLGLSLNESLRNPEKADDTMDHLLQFIYNLVREDNSYEVEDASKRLLLDLKYTTDVLQSKRGFSLGKVFNFIIQKLRLENDIFKLEAYLKTLLSYDVWSLAEILHVFVSNRELTEGSVALLISLIFGHDEVSVNWTEEQYLIFESQKAVFLSNFSSDMLKLMITAISLVDSPPEVNNSKDIIKRYEFVVLEILRDYLLQHTKFTFGLMMQTVSYDKCRKVIEDILSISKLEIKTLDEFADNVNLINEFSLPLFQIMLHFLTSQELSTQLDAKQDEICENIMTSVINHLTFHFDMSSSYFGELFTFLKWDVKEKILRTIEKKFLLDTRFFDGDPEEVVTLKNSYNLNLLPVFRDFFKKFCSSANSRHFTSNEFFTQLSVFLENLLNAVNIIDSFDKRYNLYNSLFIFIRILIIHKQALTSVITRSEAVHFAFVKNLVSLLNSPYVCMHERLKILLHDLLLLMKSSITSDFASKADLIGESTLEDHGGNRQFSFDEHHKEREINEVSSQPSPENLQATFPTQVLAAFNLPDEIQVNPLSEYVHADSVNYPFKLDEYELAYGGDISEFNKESSKLVPVKPDQDSSADFSISMTNSISSTAYPKAFKLRSFEILDSFSSNLNDGCINLSFFDAFTTKENPP